MKPKPKLRPKLRLNAVQKPKQTPKRVLSRPVALQEPADRPQVAQGVLAAQFSPVVSSPPASGSAAFLYLAFGLAAAFGLSLGLVAAAPRLVQRWPQVFVPVIGANERIVLASVCLAGAALTLVITWELTGPGG